MQDDVFCGMIATLARKHTGNDEKGIAPVVKALAAMTEDEIIGFENVLTEKLYALDGHAWARRSVDRIWWGEPRSLSTDRFLYARSVVVANGREFFASVLADHKEMPVNMEFELLIYIAMKAYELKTGLDGDAVRGRGEVSYETFLNAAVWDEIWPSGHLEAASWPMPCRDSQPTLDSESVARALPSITRQLDSPGRKRIEIDRPRPIDPANVPRHTTLRLKRSVLC